MRCYSPRAGRFAVAPVSSAPPGVDIVPEPFDTATPVRTFGSASGMPSHRDCRSAREGVARRTQSHRDATQSVLDKAFKGEL